MLWKNTKSNGRILGRLGRSDDRGRLRFPVFISRKNLRRSGKSKVPARVGFYQHTRKTPGTDAGSFQSLSITPSVFTMPIDCLSNTFSYMLASFSLTSRLGGVKQRESNKHIDTVIGVSLFYSPKPRC